MTDSDIILIVVSDGDGDGDGVFQEEEVHPGRYWKERKA